LFHKSENQLNLDKIDPQILPAQKNQAKQKSLKLFLNSQTVSPPETTLYNGIKVDQKN
jgi:hypothetical protein